MVGGFYIECMERGRMEDHVRKVNMRDNKRNDPVVCLGSEFRVESILCRLGISEVRPLNSGMVQTTFTALLSHLFPPL